MDGQLSNTTPNKITTILKMINFDFSQFFGLILCPSRLLTRVFFCIRLVPCVHVGMPSFSSLVILCLFAYFFLPSVCP
jgi:hypothetical protein